MWQVVAIVACGLGMGSKETMVTAPVAVVLFDRIFLFDSFRHGFQMRWRLYAGLAATWLILASLLSTRPRPNSAGFSTGVDVWTYLLNQTMLITRYLGLTVWPRSLVANYGWPQSLSLGDVAPYALFLVALAGLTVAALRWRPQLGFLGVWFFLTLAPTSSVIPIATEVGAERRMYLPLAALLVLAVVGVVYAWDSIKPSLGRLGASALSASVTAALLLAAVTTALATGTVARNGEYESELLLAQTNLDRYPSPVAHHWLAECLLRAGRRQEAIAHLQQALPDAPRAHYTLGVELFKDGKLPEAIEQLQAFIAKQPRLVWAVDAHGLLGQAFARQENWPASIQAFRELLKITPGNPVAEYSLATALFATERFEEAIPHYRRYLVLSPDDADALNHLGLALASTQRLAEALGTFRRAGDVDPRSGPIQHNLALALWSIGSDEALTHARAAVALQPDDPVSQELLRRILKESHQAR